MENNILPAIFHSMSDKFSNTKLSLNVFSCKRTFAIFIWNLIESNHAIKRDYSSTKYCIFIYVIELEFRVDNIFLYFGKFLPPKMYNIGKK